MKIPISIVIPYKLKNKTVFLWTQERESSDRLDGLREFPGGKVQAGETAEIAGAREVFEEVGVIVSNLKFVEKYEFKDDLVISVFAFNDDQGLFDQSAYLDSEELLSQNHRILPKNTRIITDFKLYLQGVGSLN